MSDRTERTVDLTCTESEATDVSPAHCPRCQGFLIQVMYEDWGWTTGTPTALAWSCVQCGAIIDPVITANRRARGR